MLKSVFEFYYPTRQIFMKKVNVFQNFQCQLCLTRWLYGYHFQPALRQLSVHPKIFIFTLLNLRAKVVTI